jgi:hypothetical protein
VVLAARDADLIGAEADVDEEHHHDRDPVVELRENDVQSSEFRVHLTSPVPCLRRRVCEPTSLLCPALQLAAIPRSIRVTLNGLEFFKAGSTKGRQAARRQRRSFACGEPAAFAIED